MFVGFCIWVLDLRPFSGFYFGFWVLLRMMSMTCHNLDFGTSVLDLVACGCFSNDRSSVSSYARTVSRRRRSSRGSAARRLVCCRQNLAQCRVYSTKTPDTLVNGIMFFHSLYGFIYYVALLIVLMLVLCY